MASPELIQKKLKVVRDRMIETRNTFAALKTFNKMANKQDNEFLCAKMMPYWRFFAVTNQSLKAFVLSNIVAMADPASSASLYRICRDLINAGTSGVSKGQITHWQTEISDVHNRLKDYRHNFVSHIGHEADAYIEQFNQAKFTWEDLQSDLDSLACKLEYLGAAAAGQSIPSVDDIRDEVLEYLDSAIDAQEHTAQFLRAIEQHFPQITEAPRLSSSST